MVKANLGIGFVPERFVHREDLGSTVFQISVAEPIPPRKIILLHSGHRPQTPAARELVRFLMQ